MKFFSKISALVGVGFFVLAYAGVLSAEGNPENFYYGYARADAPELAERGPFHVGVRTMKLVNHDQVDRKPCLEGICGRSY